MGDADGNGVVKLDDSRTIARWHVKQLPEIPNPGESIELIDALKV